MSKLNVEVGVNNTAFNRGLDSMRAQARAWKTDIAKSIAGAFAVSAVTGFFRSMMAEVGRIDDLSQRLGESTETIQRVGEAAHFAGSNLEMVIKSMSKLTVEAANGSEKFAALGISAQDFANAPLEGKLIMLSAALEKANGDQGQMIALMDLLGGKAQDLIPLLAQGPAALSEAFAEASIISDAAIKGITAFEDALDKSMMTIKSWVGNAVVGFQKFAASVGLAFEIVKGNISIKEAEEIFGRFGKEMGGSKPDSKTPSTIDPAGAKEQQRQAEKNAATAERLQDRLRKKALDGMDVESRLLELQQQREFLLNKSVPANLESKMTDEEKLKIAEQLLDLDQEIAAAQAEADAAAKQKADEEERAAKQAEADAAKQSESAKEEEAEAEKPESRLGLVSSSLAEVGGGGGAYVTASPEARELQQQTALLRQLVNNTSPQIQRASSSKPEDSF